MHKLTVALGTPGGTWRTDPTFSTCQSIEYSNPRRNIGYSWPYHADPRTGEWTTVDDGDWCSGHWIEALRITYERPGRVELLDDIIITRGGSTAGTRNRFLQRVLGAANVAIAAALVLAGRGGTTGNNTTADATTGSDLPFVFGAFATPLVEPWDGAVNAALESAAADGLIKYEHLDNLRTADDMERALRDIIASEGPDIIMGVIAATPIPEVNRIVNAFIAGVEETNAGATATVSLMHILSA